jgi:hypothetical protein
MKKVYVFFTAFFVVVAINALAQDSQESFILKREKNSHDGRIGSYYLDRTKKEHYPSPKDGKGKDVELAGIEVNSIEKLYQIELKIFNPEEIKYLSINNSVAQCVVSSSGKIISASFAFLGWEPKVSVTKLQEYATQIKENVTFKFTYSTDPAQEGYYIKYVPIFRSLSSQKDVK